LFERTRHFQSSSLFANLAELVERGEGFSAIALAKADEDPDSGVFEPVMVSRIVLIPDLQAIRTTKLKPNLASVPLFANLAELVERGQG